MLLPTSMQGSVSGLASLAADGFGIPAPGQALVQLGALVPHEPHTLAPQAGAAGLAALAVWEPSPIQPAGEGEQLQVQHSARTRRRHAQHERGYPYRPAEVCEMMRRSKRPRGPEARGIAAASAAGANPAKDVLQAAFTSFSKARASNAAEVDTRRTAGAAKQFVAAAIMHIQKTSLHHMLADGSKPWIVPNGLHRLPRCTWS